jgi:hypothetical protein
MKFLVRILAGKPDPCWLDLHGPGRVVHGRDGFPTAYLDRLDELQIKTLTSSNIDGLFMSSG